MSKLKEELKKEVMASKRARIEKLMHNYLNCAKKQEAFYQMDGVKSHLSTGKKNAELAEICRLALIGIDSITK